MDQELLRELQVPQMIHSTQNTEQRKNREQFVTQQPAVFALAPVEPFLHCDTIDSASRPQKRASA